MSPNFKPCNQNQLVLFSKPIDKDIDKHQPARLINKNGRSGKRIYADKT